MGIRASDGGSVKLPEQDEQRRNSGYMIRRARIGVFAATLVLFALMAGRVAADPKHHPGAGAASVPGAPGMVPGASMSAPTASPGKAGMAPIAPMGSPAASAATAGAPGMAPSAPIAPSGTSPGTPAPGMAGGGMADMMGKMMAPAAPGGCVGENCGTGAPKTPIYPSLMTLPALTPEKRAEIDALASQQINEGSAQLAKGYESLSHATQAGDHAAMQQSVGMMREGLDELGAGIAARRVLTEGKAPRNLALDWFKREMNLASPIARDEPRGFLGVTPIHLFTGVLLLAFVLGMVVMYFFKMRRAADLYGRLEGSAGPPPPGSSPPLAGIPVPSPEATALPPAESPATPVGSVAGSAPPLGASSPPGSGATSPPLTPKPRKRAP